MFSLDFEQIHWFIESNLMGIQWMGAVMLIKAKSSHKHCLILCFLHQKDFKRFETLK
jgi:hypothetical protein